MAAVAGEVARVKLDVSSSSSLTAQLLTRGGKSSSHSDVLLALRLGFVGKIRRARATIYRAFGTYA
jgi:hypothetical protein